MKKLDAFIKEHKEDFDEFTILSEEDLKKAEKKFGFEFDDTLKKFFAYSCLGYKATETCDLADSYDELQNLKNYKKEMPEGDFEPSDKVVPIHNLDDWLLVYSLGDGKPTGMYEVSLNGHITKMDETLEEYVLGEWERDLEEDED